MRRLRSAVGAAVARAAPVTAADAALWLEAPPVPGRDTNRAAFALVRRGALTPEGYTEALRSWAGRPPRLRAALFVALVPRLGAAAARHAAGALAPILDRFEPALRLAMAAVRRIAKR